MNDINFLDNVKTIAIVGLSDKPTRASFQVAEFLLSKGYKIIPVNPIIKEVFGQRSYPSLSSIPNNIKIDLVDIFRRSEEVFPIVKEAIKRKVPHIWMQEGIKNEEAMEYATKHGASVASDVCLMKSIKSI
jgi:predicted CoA-binding protein